MKKRIISLVICLAMLLALAPAASADGGNYLVLGDSISTGYGLADPEAEGFASIVANAAGYAIDNRAVNGNTADGILNQFKAGELNETVSVADVITITCGGNDLMAVLYTAISEAYNEAYPDEPILADRVTALMGGEAEMDMAKMLEMFDLVLGILNGDEAAGVPKFVESEELAAALAQYIDNLNEIMAIIRSLNADATVVVATQYHPYATFTGTFGALNTEIGAGVKLLSDAITANAETAGYLVADVHTAFEEANASGENLCNSNGALLSLNLDFHPNAAGHAVIAEVMLETLGIGATEPEVPAEPLPETVDALYADMNFVVNGETVSLEVYEINGNNYFKLRDLAMLVSGTEKQFNVFWDDAIRNIDLISNDAYAPVGGELAEGDGSNKIGKLNASPIFKDGRSVTLAAYTINGNNYFKLRDLCRAFDIGVTWNEATWTVGIDTSIGYTD